MGRAAMRKGGGGGLYEGLERICIVLDKAGQAF